MTAKGKQTRRRINKKRLLLTIMLLSISICVVFVLTDKLSIYIDRVTAIDMPEKTEDSIDKDIPSDKNEEDSVIEEGNINSGSDSKKLIENTDDILVLVNKKRYLPSNYKPSDLVVPNVKFSFDGEYEKKYMRREGASALEELFNQAREEGIYLYAVSGYRSYSTQERLFNNRANRVGEEEANKLSARPGESEHQTGLAMDISSQSAGFDLTEEFGNTVEGKWVRDNAHKFGFIIRY
ncbi:M15 family metallopeptidase [Natronincola ferrireducens]|uniref:D-alanyl-D-alanine carboxypeptidase n=1 Tax=Natronincola ferrireducens TaxID=393762 RepID=A0A1G9ECG9_9FIRM|nr:M15 family metallopeptidase [Natronincola ferrireducens]SDK73827.1 D-alanyl-D-alanine carboxypeptidase [Natronincola ferrireducens]